MNLLKILAGPMNVLDVRFPAEGEPERTVWRCDGEKAPVRIDIAWSKPPQGIWAVTVQGHGVVSKPLTVPGVAGRVMSDAATFVWSESEGDVSFVRRERLQPVLEELAGVRIFAQRIAVAEPPGKVAREFYAGLRWRDLLRIGDCGSSLSQAFGRRLLPGVLSLLLLLLGANAAVSGSLQTERQQLRALSEQRRRSGRVQAEGIAERERLLTDFSRKPVTPYALLCDRIGACVPEPVRLTLLDVEPLSRRFEAGKPLQRIRRHVTVGGECSGSSQVGNFVEELAKSGLARSVRLTSVASTREGALQFRIDLEL